MRIDATIPDADGKRLVRMARELGFSRSELVSEAVSYFLRLAGEAQAGRRLLLHDPSNELPPRELMSRAIVYRAAPTIVPMVNERVLPSRTSRLADRARQDELERISRMTPYERVAEAFELGDDAFGENE